MHKTCSGSPCGSLRRSVPNIKTSITVLPSPLFSNKCKSLNPRKLHRKCFSLRKTTNPQSRLEKNNRVRCKACSASGCRHGVSREISLEDIKEVTKERPDLLAQLPEFFGEPLLNFEEFVHYAPVFRTKALEGDEMMYFKIPRTTKERELNIPRRLNELYVRTFGPEDAPESKAFDRISPHNHLCETRMAIRNSIVKAMQETIFAGCRTMDEGNHIFSLIFRFTGVAMVKTITTNLPQVFTAVVTLKKESEDENEYEEAEAYECTGIVSLFNYHLFRRKIKQIAV
jgi:hypothetical protein